MADPQWIETFRGYSDDELRAELAKLKANVSVFSSQGVGQKNYTKDLAALREQLSSATRVATERGLITPTLPRTARSVVTDFSRN